MQTGRVLGRIACRASPACRSQRLLFGTLQGTGTDAVSMPIMPIMPEPTVPEKLKGYSPPKLVRKTWGHKPEGPTFTSKYKMEYRISQIQGAGDGSWACEDIPAGTRLRRVSIEDGSLVRFGSEEELRATGWDIDDSVNYGIGHHKDPSGIYFLNPGTTMNHADMTRDASVRYIHDEEGAIELWTIKDIKAGEEIFNNYSVDFGRCDWYDTLQQARGNIPLAWLEETINKEYLH